MKPAIYPAGRYVNGRWVEGFAVYFTPTDPDTSPMQWRPTRDRAERLAARIEKRQKRDKQWAADVLRHCTRRPA